MKSMIIFHDVSSLTVFRRYISTFNSIHFCTAVNYREFILLNVLKITRNYRKTTTKISYECKLISFSSVIRTVECTTATQTVVCALPSMLARNLQFSIWKNYFRLIVSRSWSESVLLSKTLKNVRIQLQPYCFI